MYDINKSWTAKVCENGQLSFSEGNGSKMYELASLSKAFTALSIVLLSVEGKLSLDDDVALYCDAFIFRDRKNETRTVTFRNLLQHTSGLDGHTIRFQKSGETDIVEVAKKIAKSRLMSMPNEIFCYATGGYVILGALVEIISGMSFAEFVRDRIFYPLEMTSSDASGYSLEGYRLGVWGYCRVRWKGCRAFAPAGYMVSSANDMLRFLSALADSKCQDSEITEAIKMCQDINYYTETDKEGILYGFGWFWNRELDVYYHDGCNPGHTTYMSYQKQGTKICSIWLLNCNEGSFCKTAKGCMEDWIKKGKVRIFWSIPKHFFFRFIFLFELLLTVLILKSNIPALWIFLLLILFVSKLLCWANGKLTISQIWLWANVLQLGIIYNSCFLGGVAIACVFLFLI